MECSKCKIDKPTTDFHKKKSSSTGYNFQCKICINSYHKTRKYPVRKDYMRDFYKQKSTRYKKQLIEMLGGKCNKCGLIDDPCVYDFHHTNPEQKEFSIATALKHSTWDAIKKEVSKCILLCSNCHRKLHHIKEN